MPRGAAETKFPEGVEDSSEMQISTDSHDISNVKDHPTDSEQKPTTDVQADASDSDVDLDNILAADLDKLAFYQRNRKDPYMAADPKANNLFDEEELDDLTIRKTDSLIATVTCSEDVSTLEVHVFDDNPEDSDDEEAEYKPHTYVHHEIILPSLPLCNAYTAVPVGEKVLNLVAVGMFTPGIDIWDIDRLNNLEPVQSLGGYTDNRHLDGALRAAAAIRQGKKGKQKKKPVVSLKEGSHKDAVMCLSWNKSQLEYLASGSADATVKIWDIESAHCACTISQHTDKVQSIAFHPSKENVLLSGSFDKTVRVLDVRDQTQKTTWNILSDIETCNWMNGTSKDLVVCTTEDGHVTVFDPRGTDASSPVARWQAHDGPASACSVSSDISGFMVTGGVDKMLRVWDVSTVSEGSPGELVYERNAKGGAIFSAAICPVPAYETNASPFAVAIGGAKGSLSVIDVGVESEGVRRRFLGSCSAPAVSVINRRAQRARSRPGARKSGIQIKPDEPPKGSNSSDEEVLASDSDSSHED